MNVVSIFLQQDISYYEYLLSLIEKIFSTITELMNFINFHFPVRQTLHFINQTFVNIYQFFDSHIHQISLTQIEKTIHNAISIIALRAKNTQKVCKPKKKLVKIAKF